jgi:hypothetical protein
LQSQRPTPTTPAPSPSPQGGGERAGRDVAPPPPSAEPGRSGRICDSGIAARAAQERPRAMNAKNLGGIALIVILVAAVVYALGFNP